MDLTYFNNLIKLCKQKHKRDLFSLKLQKFCAFFSFSLFAEEVTKQKYGKFRSREALKMCRKDEIHYLCGLWGLRFRENQFTRVCFSLDKIQSVGTMFFH